MATRYYNGDDPCKGCGHKIPRAGRYELCHTCQIDIREGQLVRARNENKDGREGFCRVHLAAYHLSDSYVLEDTEQPWNEKVQLQVEAPGYLTDIKEQSAGSSKDLKEAVQELLVAIAEPEGTTARYALNDRGRNTTHREDEVVIPVKAAVGLLRVFQAFGDMTRRISRERYEKGYADGNDLLGKLNSGEISTAQIENQLRK